MRAKNPELRLIENFAGELHIIYFTVRANTITVGKGAKKIRSTHNRHRASH